MIEQWRTIPGYEARYEVSDLGGVRNCVTGNVLCPTIRNKYLIVALRNNLGRKTKEVHPLVLLAFVGPRPPGYVAAHLDGVSTNNKLSNLKWVTPAENEAHKIAHGTDKRGVKSHHAKFSEMQVQIIREAHALGLSVDKIGMIAGVYGQTISDIVRGISYTNVGNHDNQKTAHLDAARVGPSRLEARR